MSQNVQLFCVTFVLECGFLAKKVVSFSLGTLSIDDEMGRRRRPEVKFSRANLLGMR